MSRDLERAIAAFRKPKLPPSPDRQLVETSDVLFRAAVDLRLQNLERQLDELKGKINGLLFLLAGAVASNIVLRLLA